MCLPWYVFGSQKVNAVCGGGDGALADRLTAIGHSGEELLESAAAKGASDPSQTRNVLVLQHYPGPVNARSEYKRVLEY